MFDAIRNPIVFELSLQDNLSTALANVTLFYFLEKARKMAEDFEAQMKNANSIFLESIEKYNKLTRQVLDLGGKTSKSLNDIAKSLYNLASAGLKTEQAFQVLKNSLQFAEATGDDIDQITEAVAKFSRSFKINFNESGEVVKEFANLINKTQIKFKDIFSSMKFATQIGALFPKQELSDVLTALGLLVNRGIPASTALRQLRSVMIDLTRDTGKLSKFLQKYGFTLKEITPETHSLSEIIAKFNKAGVSSADIMSLFGKRAAGAFKILMDEGVPAYENLKAQIKDMNTLEHQRETQMESLQRKEKMFFNYLQKIAIEGSGIRNEMLKSVYDIGLQIGNLLKQFPELENALVAVGELFSVYFSAKAISMLGGIALKMLGITKKTKILGIELANLKSIFGTVGLTIAGVVTAYTIFNIWQQKVIDKLNQEAKMAEELAIKWKAIDEIRKKGIQTDNEYLILQSKRMANELKMQNFLTQASEIKSKINQLEKEKLKIDEQELEVASDIWGFDSRVNKERKSALTHQIQLEKQRLALLNQRIEKIKDEVFYLKLKENYTKRFQNIIAKGNSFYKNEIKSIYDYLKLVDKYKLYIAEINKAVEMNVITQKEANIAIAGYNQEIDRLAKEEFPKLYSFFNDLSNLITNSYTDLENVFDFIKEYFKDFADPIEKTIEYFGDLIDATDDLGDSMHKLSIRAQQEQIFLKYKQGAISAKEAIYQMAKVAVESSNWMENAMIDYANKLADAVDTRRISAFNQELDQTIMRHDWLVTLGQRLGLTYEEAQKYADNFFDSANEKMDELIDKTSKLEHTFNTSSSNTTRPSHSNTTPSSSGGNTIDNGDAGGEVKYYPPGTYSRYINGEVYTYQGSVAVFPDGHIEIFDATWEDSVHTNFEDVVHFRQDSSKSQKSGNLRQKAVFDYGSPEYIQYVMEFNRNNFHHGEQQNVYYQHWSEHTSNSKYRNTGNIESLTFSSNDPFIQLRELNAYGYKYGFTSDLMALKKKIEQNITIRYQKEMMRDIDPRKASILDLEAKYQTYKRYDPEMAEKWYQAQRQQIEQMYSGRTSEAGWQEEMLPLAVGSNLGATSPSNFSHITAVSPNYNTFTGYTPSSHTTPTTNLSTTPMGSYSMFYGGTIATREGYKGYIAFKNIDDRIFEILDRYHAHYKKRTNQNGQLIGVNVFYNRSSKGNEIIKAIKNLYGSNNVKTIYNK